MSIVILHKFVEIFLYTLSIDKLGSPRPPPSRASMSMRIVLYVLVYLCVGYDDHCYIYFSWMQTIDFVFFLGQKTKMGGVFQEKKFFSLLICFCLGTTIPEPIFDFGSREFRIDEGPTLYFRDF